jgi:hypothetical protein
MPVFSSQVDAPSQKDGGVQSILTGAGPGIMTARQSPEDEATAKLVLESFHKARRWRSAYDRHWPRWYALWEGEHWKHKVSHTLTQAIVNMVHSACETFVGHISDAMGDPNVFSNNPAYKRKALAISKWLKYTEQHNNLDSEIDHAVRSACVTGIGWLGVDWDETENSNKGDALIKAIDERFMFPAPYCRDLRECLYLIEAKNVPREFISRTYERAELVPSGTLDVSLTNVRTYNPQSQQGDTYAAFSTTDGSQTSWTRQASAGGPGYSDLVTLMKMYSRQDDGTMRLTVVANGVVLDDGKSPYDDDDYPYAQVNILPTLDCIFGRGLTQFIEGLQELLDLTVSYQFDQQRYDSDPMMGVHFTNIEDGNYIDNNPGAILVDHTPNGRGYYWVQAPGANPHWVQIQETVKQYIDEVLGRVDVLKGEHTPGVDTLGALEIIRDEANVRLRKQIKWVRASKKRVSLLTLSRLRQFAEDERMFRITGKFGQEEYVTVNQNMGVDPDGNLAKDITIPKNVEFDLEFENQPPGGDQARHEQAMQLLNTKCEDGFPAVDRQYVLEQFRVNDIQTLMQRFGSMKSAQAQAQVQQQAIQAHMDGKSIAMPEDSTNSLHEMMG